MMDTRFRKVADNLALVNDPTIIYDFLQLAYENGHIDGEQAALDVLQTELPVQPTTNAQTR